MKSADLSLKGIRDIEPIENFVDAEAEKPEFDGYSEIPVKGAKLILTRMTKETDIDAKTGKDIYGLTITDRADGGPEIGLRISYASDFGSVSATGSDGELLRGSKQQAAIERVISEVVEFLPYAEQEDWES
jgi:hypothetical protein